jgi:hypothetical protein
LKHYTIIFPRDLETLKHPGIVNRPLCLNPRKDYVFINFVAFYHYPVLTFKSLLEFKTKFPKCFNAITSVDIRNYWHEGSMNKPSFKDDAPEMKESLVGSDLRGGAF